MEFTYATSLYFPGVSLLNVEKLNLLTLAPGGHVGRFCIWTESALGKLDALHGTWRKPSLLKTNYNLPQPLVSNSDLTKLFQSEEIQVGDWNSISKISVCLSVLLPACLPACLSVFLSVCLFVCNSSIPFFRLLCDQRRKVRLRRRSSGTHLRTRTRWRA
jgi:hypothetical protein